MKIKLTEKQIKNLVNIFENEIGVIVFPNGNTQQKIDAVLETYFKLEKKLKEEEKENRMVN